MRTVTRAILAGILGIGLGQILGTSAAQAQGPIGSLGGYGGSMSDTGSGAAMSGPIIPYAGRFGGFMPYRMGTGGSLTFQPRGASSMRSSRTPFSLSPMSGGISSMSGGMGQGPGNGSRSAMGVGTGMGLGGGTQPMAGPRSMGVMPPSFGYPFRQPPSLLAPTSSGTGMSM
jgi:hypothetical protein